MLKGFGRRWTGLLRTYWRRGKNTLAVGGLVLLFGCAAWKEPWSSSGKKLADLCRPFHAQKEAESFRSKVQKDPFPDASVLNKALAATPSGQ